MKKTSYSFLAIAIMSFLEGNLPAETATYTYDAKGRLVRVVKSGGPDHGAITTYEQDKADNRQVVRTTGAPR